jgi:hypothetical protein
MKISNQNKTIIITIGIVAPILLFLYYILKFGVDVPRWDEWNIAEILKVYYNKGDWLSMVFAQHNEHRIVFPRIVLLALASLTDWNVKAEMIASWVIHVLNFLLIWGILKQVEVKHKWLLVPIAWLMFNVGQWENMLWGWCFHWYLMIFGFLLALYLLTKIASSAWYILPAIIAGIISSFSFNNGLLIWPLGLFYLFFIKELKSNRKKLISLWLIIGIFTFIIYYMDYTKPAYHPPLLLFLYKPFLFLICLFGNLGSGLGGEKLIPSIIGGVVILSASIASILLMRKATKDKVIVLAPVFILGLFSLISVAAISVGRFSFGATESIVPRYVTIASFLIITDVILFAVIAQNAIDTKLQRRMKLLNIIFLSVISIGLFLTLLKGWQTGRAVYFERMKAAVYLKQYKFAPNRVLSLFLHPSPDLIQELAPLLKQKKLTVFRNEEEVNLNDYKEIVIRDTDKTGDIDIAKLIPAQYSNGKDEVLYVSGWAIDPVIQEIPKAVFVFLDNKLIGKAVLGNPRQDIGKKLNMNSFILSGWEIFVPVTGLNALPGMHNITTRVLLNGQNNYFYDITKQMKIE